MFVLPVSGIPVRFRALEGHDELLLAEGAEPPLRLRVEAARRLTPPADATIRWDDLPFADVDAALLAVRQRLSGDRLVAEVRCSACDIWCDTELSIAEYLAANRPRHVAGLTAQAGGWLEWRDVLFRVPTVSDVLQSAAAGAGATPSRRLLERTIGVAAPKLISRAASLLERLAPPLAGVVQGRCPHCQERVQGWFDPGLFVLRELQSRAAVMFEQVHRLAQAYGWTEAEILKLPSRRRALYAARIEQETSA